MIIKKSHSKKKVLNGEQSEEDNEITLLDRISIGVVSAISFLITFYLLYAVTFVVFYFPIPIEIIVFFTLMFFIIGFISLDNYFIKMLSPIWEYLGDFFKQWGR